MPKYETNADREEKYRLLRIERFERDTFDDFINALAEAGNMSPVVICSLIHHVTTYGLVKSVHRSENGSISYSVNKRYCGLTPLEIAWHLFLYQQPITAVVGKRKEKFDPDSIAELARQLSQTSMVYAFAHEE